MIQGSCEFSRCLIYELWLNKYKNNGLPNELISMSNDPLFSMFFNLTHL